MKKQQTSQLKNTHRHSIRVKTCTILTYINESSTCSFALNISKTTTASVTGAPFFLTPRASPSNQQNMLFCLFKAQYFAYLQFNNGILVSI
jgi:hypothetical protein